MMRKQRETDPSENENKCKVKTFGQKGYEKTSFLGKMRMKKVPWCGRRRWKEQERKPLID